MKRIKLFICLILSVLCIATWGCSGGNDNNNDNNYILPGGGSTPGGGGGSTISLNGAEWRYDEDEYVTALIAFTSNKFNAAITEDPYSQHPTSNEYMGTYSYDGETFTATYDGNSVKLWCSRKVTENTLAGTRWESETIDEDGSYRGYCEFFADGTYNMHNFIEWGHKKGDDQSNDKGSRRWSYDGRTFMILYGDGYVEFSLQLGDILYVMSNVNK